MRCGRKDGAIDSSVCCQLGLYVGHNCHRQACICRGLSTVGLEMHKASTLLMAKEMVREHYYQLFILHCDAIGRPVSDFCRFVRSNNARAIMVTLMRQTNLNLERKLFDCGVNDVVVGEQTCPRVFTRRIKSHLSWRSCPTLSDTNPVRLKNTIVDFDRREVWCNGANRHLPGILVDLLKYFLDNPHRVISRQELFRSHMWVLSIPTPAEEGGKTFDVTVSKLRKVIEFDPAHPQIIISVRGRGWKLAGDLIR